MLDFESHAIVEPDALLASQLEARSGLPEPEYALMVAVLEDAVRCYLNYADAADHKQRALAQDAVAWFASTERTQLFDFENVCDVLGIDAGYFREGLQRRRAQRRASAARPATPHFSHRTHRPAGSA